MRLPAARRGCTRSAHSPPELAANFSPRAQQALALALRETERFNPNFVGTEHVLLGLISPGQGIAVNVLQKMGVDLETVRKEVENQVGRGPGQKAIGAIPYTPRVKKVLALAAKEARGLNHTYVGTEHLLLGLLREGDGVAARVLSNQDVDIVQTRREILKELDPNFTQAAEENLVVRKCSAMPTNPTINRATHILQGYYRKLAEEIAQDIIHHESDFVSSGFSEADSVLDRHSRRLWDYRDADGFPTLDCFVSTGADSWSGAIDCGDPAGSCRIHRLFHGITNRLQCRESVSVSIERHWPGMAGLVSCT